MNLIANKSFCGRGYGSVSRGDSFVAGDAEARQLIARGMAKAAEEHVNKMAPEPSNKSNPSSTAGATAQSSASPAVPASPQANAKPSKRGGKRSKADE